MKPRDAYAAFVIWVVLTALGEAFVLRANIYPLAGNEFARDVDDAFRLLMALAVPVFTFVVTVLVYSLLRFRRNGEPAEDGPPIHSHRGAVWGWFAVTSGLTLLVMVHPGFTGLLELRESRHQEMVVAVQAAQWSWNFTFPGRSELEKVKDLKLPTDTKIRFDVTSRDVVHSFWLPMYRMKIDAVPGRVNSVYVATEEAVSYGENVNVRVQCAELCGTGHPRMQVRVEVVERPEFDAWLAEQEAG